MSRSYLKTLLFNLLMIIMIAGCQSSLKQWEVKSPDNKLIFELTLEKHENDSSDLTYRILQVVDSGELEVIKSSPLGLLRNDAAFDKNLHDYSETKLADFNESYDLFTGKVRHVEKTGRQQSITFQNEKNQLLSIDVKVFNDGAAFRYRFSDTNPEPVSVTHENTGFHLPAIGKAWMAPYDKITQFSPAYETFYENGISIGDRSPHDEGWSFPMLFELKHTWVLISEANLHDNFFGSHLEADAARGLYRVRLPESDEALNTGEPFAQQTLPWTMPWRTITIGKELSDIVNSTLVTDVSDSSMLKDFSWVNPGRCTWSWWSDHNSPKDFNALKKFIDFSADLGWEYSLVDANWNSMQGGSIEELIEYAHGKNIGIIMWYNSGGPHNAVTEEVRDKMHDPDKRREEFEKLKKWGVKGLKVDFFQSDKPHIIKLYHDILKDAAEFEIMINFHGCTIPRGWRRTYPHLVSMESVRGAEYYSFDENYPEFAPRQNTILPFTRNVIGPMDYTPISFSDQVYPHSTTNAHELALSVIFESGILHLADKPESVFVQPGYVIDFLKGIPVTWEETRLIEGYPGDYVVLARKNNKTWYFAGINGSEEPKTVKFKLPFIGEGLYLAEIIGDGKEPRSFTYYKKPFSFDKTIDIPMAPRGGFAGKLVLK